MISIPIKSKFLFIIAFLFCFNIISADYITNQPYQVKQPDGNVVNCFLSGDEFYSWLHDKNGYTIIQASNGYYYYAEQDGDLIKPSRYLVNTVNPVLIGLTRWTRISEKEYYSRVGFKNGTESTRKALKANAPSVGIINNLIIYIRFMDDPEFTTTRQVYDEEFNLESGISLKSYFKEVSYNNITINSSHYPECPLTTNFSYQDPHPRDYYRVYNATTNPVGYSGPIQRMEREYNLLASAINWINIISPVPASLETDMNEDNLIDNVSFIIKGGYEAWNELLWPHRSELASPQVYINGKRVYDYNLLLERSGVRTYCHEMFHTIGAPDLYHYSSQGLISPASNWDLMDGGSGHMLAYMKYKYSNNVWINDIPEITASGTYTLNPVTSPVNNCYKIACPNSIYEYFVVEYRNKAGEFESAIPGSGLIVYRIDTRYRGNAYGPPDEVYVYRPGGTLNSNGSPFDAFFSQSAGRTSINNITNPSCFLQDGSPGGLNISNVSSPGATISFDITMPSPPVSDADGNSYKTVRIGSQVWMAENLKTTINNDFTPISYITNKDSWTAMNTAAYCWFNNDPSHYKATYGALYNFYAVNSSKLCPAGWHVPNMTEWKNLTDFLTGNGYGFEGSGDDIAKSLASISGWTNSDIAGNVGNDQLTNNTSGFNAFPGGGRSADGTFAAIGDNSVWWLANENNEAYPEFRGIAHDANYVYKGSEDKRTGFSVRCIQDNPDRILVLIEIRGPTRIEEETSNQFTCIAFYNDGSSTDITPTAIWSENSTYTTINSSGLLTASSVTSDQSCIVTASYRGMSDTHSVTIVNIPAILTSISISGATSINENTSSQYICTAYYDDGSSQVVTNAATWSENSVYTTISSVGLLTASSVSSDQSCTITAAYGGMSDTHSVTILNVPAVLTSIIITGAASIDENTSSQYTCTAYYDDGSSQVITGDATWSENSNYTTISSRGLLTASSVDANQQIMVTASFNGMNNTFIVIIINVPSTSITLYDSNNNVINHDDTIKISTTDAGLITFKVESELDWSIAESSLWFSALKENNTTLKVNYLENISKKDKISPLTVKNESNNQVRVYIQQKAKASSLRTNKFENVIMYPNPARETVSITFGEEEFERIIITISDIQGHVLKTKEFRNIWPNQIIEVGIKEFSSGQYFIHIGDGNIRRTLQLIVI